MDIKRKTCDIRTWQKKNVISRNILHQHWYTCPIALPVRRNPQHRSLCFCRNLNKATWSGIFCDFRTSLREFLDPIVIRFTRQTLPTVNRIISLWISFALSPFAHKGRTTERCSSVAYSSKRHFDYWNQPLNMLMRVCYLDYHETGLCCYLAIHIENLLRPLQCFRSIWDLFTDSLSYICKIYITKAVLQHDLRTQTQTKKSDHELH
jgi:hypothetical protein